MELSQAIGLAVFSCLYILSLAGFGWRYYTLYKKDNDNFIIQEGIRWGKKHEEEINRIRTENRLNYELFRTRIKREALEHVDFQLREGNRIDDITAEEKRYSLPSGISYYCYEQMDPGSPSSPVVRNYLYVQVMDKNERLLESIEIEGPFGFQDERTYDIKGTLDQTRNAQTTLENKLMELDSSSSPAGRWSFWDFFYFSVSTQTTLGFGDILPNSSRIRKLVMVQVVVGLIMLGLVINFAIQPAASA